MLGASNTPAFVFIRASQAKREMFYRKLQELPVQRILSVKGDMDIVSFVEPEKLDETLKKISAIEGVEETKFYVATDVLK
jgi:DNA-binding Lrp family transcriptional regulator